MLELSQQLNKAIIFINSLFGQDIQIPQKPAEQIVVSFVDTCIEQQIIPGYGPITFLNKARIATFIEQLISLPQLPTSLKPLWPELPFHVINCTEKLYQWWILEQQNNKISQDKIEQINKLTIAICNEITELCSKKIKQEHLRITMEQSLQEKNQSLLGDTTEQIDAATRELLELEEKVEQARARKSKLEQELCDKMKIASNINQQEHHSRLVIQKDETSDWQALFSSNIECQELCQRINLERSFLLKHNKKIPWIYLESHRYMATKWLQEHEALVNNCLNDISLKLCCSDEAKDRISIQNQEVFPADMFAQWQQQLAYLHTQNQTVINHQALVNHCLTYINLKLCCSDEAKDRISIQNQEAFPAGMFAQWQQQLAYLHTQNQAVINHQVLVNNYLNYIKILNQPKLCCSQEEKGRKFIQNQEYAARANINKQKLKALPPVKLRTSKPSTPSKKTSKQPDTTVPQPKNTQALITENGYDRHNQIRMANKILEQVTNSRDKKNRFFTDVNFPKLESIDISHPICQATSILVYNLVNDHKFNHDSLYVFLHTFFKNSNQINLLCPVIVNEYINFKINNQELTEDLKARVLNKKNTFTPDFIELAKTMPSSITSKHIDYNEQACKTLIDVIFVYNYYQTILFISLQLCNVIETYCKNKNLNPLKKLTPLHDLYELMMKKKQMNKWANFNNYVFLILQPKLIIEADSGTVEISASVVNAYKTLNQNYLC